MNSRLPWLQTINPSQGPPGTAVTAVGLNVDAGDTVLVNGQNVAATSPASGQLHFTMPIPLAGGTATIAIRRASDGVASNSMNFQRAASHPQQFGGRGLYSWTDDHAQRGGVPTQCQRPFYPLGTTRTGDRGAIDCRRWQFPPIYRAICHRRSVPRSSGGDGDRRECGWINRATPLQITRLSFVANGFLPNPNGFAFKNFAPGTPDWGTFTDDFGSVEVPASAFTMPVLTGAYFGAYEYFLGSACTGLCTGFSLAAMNRFLNGETRTVDEAAAPTPALTREFTVNMGRLLSGQLLSTFLSQCLNGLPQAQTTLEQIEQTFTNGPTRDNMPIIFFIPAGLPVSSQWFNNLNASHCLVPYMLTRPVGWTSGYNGVQLFLYDCNDPENNACCLTFQQRGNTLAFTYSAD